MFGNTRHKDTVENQQIADWFFNSSKWLLGVGELVDFITEYCMYNNVDAFFFLWSPPNRVPLKMVPTVREKRIVEFMFCYLKKTIPKLERSQELWQFKNHTDCPTP